MRTTTFELIGHSGDQLAARLDKTDGPIHATALFAHCFTCSKDLKMVRPARRPADALMAFQPW